MVDGKENYKFDLGVKGLRITSANKKRDSIALRMILKT